MDKKFISFHDILVSSLDVPSYLSFRLIISIIHDIWDLFVSSRVPFRRHVIFFFLVAQYRTGNRPFMHIFHKKPLLIDTSLFGI